MAIDIVSLHVKLSDILARVLAFVEDFDCDTVGKFLNYYHSFTLIKDLLQGILRQLSVILGA